jgi:hypothetical protein
LSGAPPPTQTKRAMLIGASALERVVRRQPFHCISTTFETGPWSFPFGTTKYFRLHFGHSTLVPEETPLSAPVRPSKGSGRPHTHIQAALFPVAMARDVLPPINSTATMFCACGIIVDV